MLANSFAVRYNYTPAGDREFDDQEDLVDPEEEPQKEGKSKKKKSTKKNVATTAVSPTSPTKEPLLKEDHEARPDAELFQNKQSVLHLDVNNQAVADGNAFAAMMDTGSMSVEGSSEVYVVQKGS
jgi:hypothetical protein